MSGVGAGGRVPARESRPGRGRYAFLLTASWARILAVGVLVSLACAALGSWQWNRHTARVAAVERVEANYEAPPVPLAEVLPEARSPLPREDAWLPATATGAYASPGTVLLRNRPVAGTPAHHVLAPLVVTLPDGQQAVLVVDRGWVPAGTEEGAAGVPAPPAGQVDVVVRLRPAEAPARRDAPAGQVYAVAPAEVLAAAEVGRDVAALPVLDAYGVLAGEEPRPDRAPRLLPRPDTDLGTHLSYTFQWWVLSLGALVALVVLARREAAHGGSGAPFAEDRRRVRPLGRAEQEEDAILDEQLSGRPVVAPPVAPGEALDGATSGR